MITTSPRHRATPVARMIRSAPAAESRRRTIPASSRTSCRTGIEPLPSSTSITIGTSRNAARAGSTGLLDDKLGEKDIVHLEAERVRGTLRDLFLEGRL